MRIVVSVRRYARSVVAGLAVAVVAVCAAPRAGASTAQYLLMAGRINTLTCDDFRYAASRGLIEPVEVHWLLDARPQPTNCLSPGSTSIRGNDPNFVQSNRAYYVMLALAAKNQLTCDDIRWNSRYGFVHYDQAGDLLGRVPGCALSEYEFLVTQAYGDRPINNLLGIVEDQGVLACSDVNFRVVGRLITPEQAGWLRDVFIRRGISCGPPAPPRPVAASLPPGALIVDYLATPGSGCWADAEKYAYTSTGELLRCRETEVENFFFTPFLWLSP